jgi:two-component system, sensor histidine kinase and response regulator
VNWTFLDVFKTIDSEAPYQGAYDPRLVAISVLIAILAAFVAISISSRIVASTSRRGRWAWASAGAFSMGGGIWAMHFIGMLAFSLPCGISYDPVGTLLSMIPGILASGVALQFISHTTEPSPTRLFVGAVLMGAGIGAMHYSGMVAVRSEALLRYEPGLVAVSVIVAVVLAFISLEIRFRLRRYWSSDTLATLFAAVVMGLAVAGMHYTAMQASVFFPAANDQAIGEVLPTTLMALLITVISVLIAAVAIVASIAGRQSELATGLKIEVGRRQALEQEAEGGRARLQAIFDAVADAIVTIDQTGRIQQWSSGAQRIFGYAPEEVVGAELTILMPEPHRSGHAGYMMSYLKTRDAKIIGVGRELTAIRKDGTEFPIELTVSEVRNGGEVFFTGILRDITERKRAETELVRARELAEAASLAKSQFLATMSHEIRTPMNGVLGMAGLLSSTALNERQRRLVENVSRSGQALLGIINDVLDFAKIEAGKFELSAMPFEPREVMAELTDLFSERCSYKGLEFVYFVAEDVPSQLVGDSSRLRQILVNLVGNAIKFTEHGEILVEISLLRNDPDEVMLNFSIEDTGIGIAPEQCSRVFEAFHQVDGSMTRSRGGSGLGLSITRQLVELMGGEISVASELGQGSRFTFTASFRPSTRAAEPRPLRHLARPLRVLLADANAVSAHVISLYLASWKLDATIVSTLEKAESRWRKAAAAGYPFDVAILDVKGFGAQAGEFARSVRAKPSARRTEIVLLVGLDSYMTDSSLEALDAAAILPKPAQPSELFNALVSIASEGTQCSPMPHFARRKVPDELPNFAARILVAEDNPVNQEVATGILETMGCRVVSAPNGRAAFRLFAQEKFDAVLMDCEMPIMDGIEATRQIRKIEATVQPDDGVVRRTPIIALTAHALNEVREKCFQAGMDDFLVKPFNDQQMAKTLLRWLVPNGTMEKGCGQVDADADVDTAPSIVPETKSEQDAVIDATVIDGLRGPGRNGGPSRLERAVSCFVEIAPSLAATIRENSEAGDADALWRAAHSLRSSAGALGANRLSRRCAEIELRARNSGVEAAKPLVGALDDDLTAAIHGLQALTGDMHVPA